MQLRWVVIQVPDNDPYQLTLGYFVGYAVPELVLEGPQEPLRMRWVNFSTRQLVNDAGVPAASYTYHESATPALAESCAILA